MIPADAAIAAAALARPFDASPANPHSYLIRDLSTSNTGDGKSGSGNTAGTVVNYSSSHVCTGAECCASTSRSGGNINGTHWWGYGVDGPTAYQNITGGIWIKGQDKDGKDATVFVADCGSSVDVGLYVHQGENGVGKVAVKWGVVGLGVMMVLAATLA